MTTDQDKAISRLFENDETLLVGTMGFGKTVAALTAMKELLEEGVCKRILVIAPLRVCQLTWSGEHRDWAHLHHLDVGICIGNEQTRKSVLNKKHAITVINFENVEWLVRRSGCIDQFDGLVIDELTKLKNAGGVVFKALRPRIKKFKWRVGMTGTPVSEDYQGLYGQMMMIDGGARLGTRKDTFLNEYFYPLDFNRYNWALKPEAEARMLDKLRDVIYIAGEYTDELPALYVHDIEVELPEQARDVYDTMARDMLVDLEESGVLSSGGIVEAPNSAVLQGKLQQIANGFFYIEEHQKPDFERSRVLPKTRGVLPRAAAPLHDAKIEIIKAFTRVHDFKAGGGVVIVYWFAHELTELLKAYPNAGVIGAGSDSPAVVSAWNSGGLDVLLIHPKSAGHGLNIAKGGATMFWFAPCWSRDLWLQTIARLWRRGQTRPVNVRVLVARDTVDELIRLRVEGKADHDVSFKAHLKARAGFSA